VHYTVQRSATAVGRQKKCLSVDSCVENENLKFACFIVLINAYN
jgi:hypothetical protein